MRMMQSQMSSEQKDFLSVLGYNYLKKNKLDKAIVVYEALVRLYPNEMQYAFSLSYLYLQTKQYEKALHYAEKFLVSNPQDKALLGYLLKGRALYKLGRENEGRQAVRQFFNARMEAGEV